MKKIGTLASYIGVALIVAVGITQCVEVSKTMPDNAVVLADDEQKLYHSPIHFRDDKIEVPSNLRKTTAAEAKSQKYKGDPVCKDREYFSHERGSLLKATLSDWTGLASQPRWNDDGSWNWFGGQLYFQGGGVPTIMAIVGAAIGLFVARSENPSIPN